MCTKVFYNGIKYTSFLNVGTKHCDYCVQTVDGIFGFIKYFVFNDDTIYVIFRKIVKLLESFYDPAYPQLKSKIFLCKLTEQTCVTTIEKICKIFLIKVSNFKMFISTLSISHLFM